MRKLNCLSDKNRSKKRGTVTRATNGGFSLKRWAYQAVRLNGTACPKCLVHGPLLPVPRGTAGPTGPIPKVPVGAVPYRGLPLGVRLVRLCIAQLSHLMLKEGGARNTIIDLNRDAILFQAFVGTQDRLPRFRSNRVITSTLANYLPAPNR